jgi:hypothetical protein
MLTCGGGLLPQWLIMEDLITLIQNQKTISFEIYLMTCRWVMT